MRPAAIPDGAGASTEPRALAVLGACCVGCAAFVPIGKAPFNLFFWVGVLAFAAIALRVPGTLSRSLRNPVAAGGLALFGLYAASLAWTEAPLKAALEQLSSYRVLLMPAFMLPALCRPRWRERALIALLAGCTVVLVLGWIQWVQPLPFARATREAEVIDGPDVYVFTDRIRQNVHLSVLLLWAAGMALLVRDLGRPGRALAVLLALACAVQMLWLLQGRTGWLLVVGLAVFLLHARQGGRGLAIGLAIAAAVAVAALIGSPVVGARLAGTVRDIQDYLQSGAFNATGARLQMWGQALRMFADAPVIGHGIESYPLLSARMFAEAGLQPPIVYHDPHQELLYVGAELGAVGIVALVAALVGLWRLAGRFDDRWRWIARGGVAIYVSAGLANGLLNVGWTGYLFGLMLALVAGRHATAGDRIPPIGPAAARDPESP